MARRDYSDEFRRDAVKEDERKVKISRMWSHYGE
jgi:hypothetical protein